MVKVSVKNRKNIKNLLKLPEKWWTYKLTRLWMAFNFFWFCLTLSVPEKLKNSIFEMPIITQTLNINNLRTTSANSINLHTVKLVEYSLKIVWQRRCLLLPFSRYYCPKVGWYCDPPSGTQGAKGLTKLVWNKTQ